MQSIKRHLLQSLSLPQRAAKHVRFGRIFSRYRDATMIRGPAYIDNLRLASLAADDPKLAGFSVVECGTWRGGMSAGLIEIMGGRRSYHFFDSFEGLPPAKEIDGEGALRWQRDTTGSMYFDNCTASLEEFMTTINRTGVNSEHVQVHKGPFEQTTSKAETGAIAFLRLDGDWYDSTTCCLEALFPRVVDGGLIVIDDYGTWDGCTRAVHDYLSRHKRPEAVRRYGISQVPFLQRRDASSHDAKLTQ